MPTYTFYIYSVDVLSFNAATNAFDFKGDYEHWQDRYRIEVNDDDNLMDANGDTNQNAVIYDSDDNIVDSGNIFVPAYAEVSAGGGRFLFLDRIEVDGVHYGYVSSVPLVPGSSYALSMSDTFEDNHTYYQTNSVPCFGPDTLIDTVDGPCPVSKLRIGDRVLTYDRGAQPVLWSGSRRISRLQALATPNIRPVLYSGGMRGLNTPTHPLTLSQQHRVMIRDPFVELIAHAPEAFVRAGQLGKPFMPRDTLEWHHFLLPNHDIVRANGIWVESLFAGDALPDILTPDQYSDVEQALGPAIHRETARPCLRTYEAHCLLSRLRQTSPDTRRNKRVA